MRVQKSKNAIGFSKARRKVSPYLFQFSKLFFWNWRARTHRRLLFCLFLSIALANSLNDWRLTSLNIRILFIGWYGLVQKFATFEGLANVLEKLAYMLNCQYICSGVIWRGSMNVKMKTTAEKISESERTALYSISFEKDGTAEFENCVYIACAYRNR